MEAHAILSRFEFDFMVFLNENVSPFLHSNNKYRLYFQTELWMLHVYD